MVTVWLYIMVNSWPTISEFTIVFPYNIFRIFFSVYLAVLWKFYMLCRAGIYLDSFCVVFWPLFLMNGTGHIDCSSCRYYTSSPDWFMRLLIPWCRVLLEKLTGLQLVKKFPAFHGTRRFITALTSVRHLSLSWSSPVQSIYPHPTSWRSILIFTHLCLGLPNGLLPSGFPNKTLYTPLSSPICATCPAHRILLNFMLSEFQSWIPILCISAGIVSPPGAYYSSGTR